MTTTRSTSPPCLNRVCDHQHDTDPESNGNAGFSGQIQLYNASTGQTANINYEDIETFVPCFTPGTLIATARGECPVEDLRVGDRVVTRDNGLQEIRWVGRRDLSEAELALTPHLRPVLIRAGSLGENLPDRDMHVSPNHRMLLAEDRSVLYFDEYEVLAAAKHLTHRSGVDTLPRGGVSYLHFMCDRHEIVLGDNAWSESSNPATNPSEVCARHNATRYLNSSPSLKPVPGATPIPPPA